MKLRLSTKIMITLCTTLWCMAAHFQNALSNGRFEAITTWLSGFNATAFSLSTRRIKLLTLTLVFAGLLIGQTAWAQTPGGVSTNLRVWFKADDGTNTTTEGGSVSNWQDKSGNGFHIFQNTAAQQPKYRQNGFNFNPSVRFARSAIGNLLGRQILSQTNPVSVFDVAQADDITPTWQQIVSFDGPLDYPGDHFQYSDYVVYVDVTAPIRTDLPLNNGTNPYAFYNTHANLAGAAGTRQVGYNGLGNKLTPTMSDGLFFAGGDGGAAATAHFALGSQYSTTDSEPLVAGAIPEVIVYNRVLSNTEIQKVLSYMSVKYGLTMDNTTNYLNSAGTTIWTANTTYDNRIFGLMKDDGSGLNQRVSQSVNTGTTNLILSLNGDYASLNNAASRTTSLTNLQSFMVADDNIAMSTKTGFVASCSNPSAFILSRKWKAQNVGNVGAVYFTVNLSSSGINANPKMVIWSTGNVMREIPGLMNGDGTASFAAVVKDGETFTFSGEVVAGTCATCTGAGSLPWKTSGWVAGSNGPTTLAIAGTDASVAVQFTDPDAVEYAPAVRPIRRGKTLMMDRRDKIDIAVGGAYTATFNLTKAALPSFTIHDVDGHGPCKDVVEVKGYCGATQITPKLSYVGKAAVSSYTISGAVATGKIRTDLGYFDKRAMLNVYFDTPVDKIEVVWKTDKPTAVKRFQRLGLSSLDFACPALEPCLQNDEQITFQKEIPGGSSSIPYCENIRFKYTLKNTNCVAKTVTIDDVLPAGMTWVAGSFEDGSLTSGTPNAYGGTNTFTLTNLSLAANETAVFYVDANFTTTTPTSFGNRATMAVSGGTTIQSGCGNTTWSSRAPDVVLPPTPNITLAASNACYNANGVITFTVTMNNTTGSAIPNVEFSTILNDEFMMVGGSVSNVFGGTANDYTDSEILELSGMTIPAGTSTFTYQANANASVNTFDLTASLMVNPDAECAFENSKQSNTVNLALCTCTAPVITTQPVAPTVCAGSTGTATVAATGTTLTYQWEWGTNGTTASGNAGESGNNTATITLGVNGTYYRCKVTSNGTCNTYSNWIQFVTTALPVITTQPSAVTFCAGSTGTTTVVATGTGLTYQWESKPVGSVYGNAGEGGNGTATITLETGSHPTYRCKITNSVGCSVYTNEIPFTLKTLPVITTQPSAVTFCPGSTGTATVVATGTGLTYQWESKPVGSIYGNAGEGGNGTATITLETGSHPTYRCKITNSVGCSVYTNEITFTLKAAPTLSSVAKTDPSVSSCPSLNDGTITVTATGADLQYSKDNGANWQASNSFTGLVAGNYTIKVKNNTTGCEVAYASNPVVLNASSCGSCPTLTNTAGNNVNPTTCGGSNGSLKICGLGASSTGWTLTYDKNGTAATPMTALTADASGCLTISSLTAGAYTNIKVTHATSCPSGSGTVSATLTDPALPVITTQPSAVTFCAGSTGTTTVVATGTGLTYQWESKPVGSVYGNAGEGGNGTATITLETGSHPTYRCKITNAAGCSVYTNEIPFTLLASPTLSSVAKTDPSVSSCPSLNDGTITVMATGANLQYSKDNGLTWQASNSFTGLSAGSYTIKVKNNTTGCEVAHASNPVVLTAPTCVTCATPTVGGTAAYTGGTVCSASNIGTATLSGQTGAVVRWETSTNSGSTWSPLVATTNSYNFANAANGQQYRAVLNNGSGCLDVNSAPATIVTNTTNCTSTTCDNTTGNITFTAPTTPNLTGYDSKIIMTNASGVIQYTTAVNGLTINGVAVGDYLAYRVVYDPAQLPIPNLTVGVNITAIGGACVKYTNQVAYKVCVATAPDLTTTIGQPSPALIAGQVSNLPITVANIGTGPAPGIITTTITLPAGVTAPTNFTSNGWTCSTTAPSVTCTNPGPIAAGANSVFNVPITPDATTVGTKPIFNANTNPVTGETNTGNNSATPLTPTVNVQPMNCNWIPGAIGK